MFYLKEAKDVPEQHYFLLAELLNTAWKDLIVTTPEHLRSRFASGNKFFIAYGEPALVDKEKLASEYGIALPELSGLSVASKLPEEENKEVNKEDIPLGLLETIALKTQGVIYRVPRTYAELTNSGFWRPPEEKADTIIMVDVTKIPTVKEDVASFLMGAVKYFLHDSSLWSAWTFTPDIDAVKKWHESFGAKDTRYGFPNARQGWKQPAVNIMDYSHMIKGSPLVSISLQSPYTLR